MLKSGQLGEACLLCEKLCARKSADAKTFSLLGEIYGRMGRYSNAVTVLHRGFQMAPTDGNICALLADALLHQGAMEEAARYYERACNLQPGNPKLLINLAGILIGMRRASEAEPLLHEAIRISPELPQAYNNLGSSLLDQGRVAEALECYERGLNAADDDPAIHSNYLLCMHYTERLSIRASLDAHREWECRHALQSVASKSVKYNHDKLRIGFVSPDFRTHSVSYFLVPLFSNYDSKEFIFYCYSDVRSPDAMTRSLMGLVDSWRNTTQFNDEELARCIRSDEIDILVDLSGHTAGNRLGVFARRASPVQVTWLGYPDTTGLEVMDYRVSDAIADPPGFDEYYCEQLVRLEGCFVCYSPSTDAPEPLPSPVIENGFVTFGSFNNLSKITDEVIKAWSDILHRVPDARLFIKNPGLADNVVRARYLSAFVQQGINNERIDLKGLSPTTKEHLAEYGNIDIALDTFPYNGTTTTCEALWMGVPVLTFIGNNHAGCVGASLLSAAGMSDWVSVSLAAYVNNAVNLADDRELLVQKRAILREKMAGSVLCNGGRFARIFENACRSMWEAMN